MILLSEINIRLIVVSCNKIRTLEVVESILNNNSFNFLIWQIINPQQMKEIVFFVK
jgi:hypothetical protein